MQPANEDRDGRKGIIVLRPWRVRRNGHVSLDEQQPFATVALDADWDRRCVETMLVQPCQETMDRRRMSV